VHQAPSSQARHTAAPGLAAAPAAAGAVRLLRRRRVAVVLVGQGQQRDEQSVRCDVRITKQLGSHGACIKVEIDKHTRGALSDGMRATRQQQPSDATAHQPNTSAQSCQHTQSMAAMAAVMCCWLMQVQCARCSVQVFSQVKSVKSSQEGEAL
jgi:hypothetical protein